MVYLVEAKERINIPEGVTVDVVANTHVTVKGPNGELKRSFREPRILIEKQEDRVLVHCAYPRKVEKAAVGTVASHITNMVRGVTDGYTYRMKIVFSHFPIKTQIKGNVFEVQNFLGERSARRATILPGVKVESKGDAVTLTGLNVEDVSQTAANIEQATRVRYRDTRVFQDGIYVVSKEA
jgi:large subunit ribosomal protein L6